MSRYKTKITSTILYKNNWITQEMFELINSNGDMVLDISNYPLKHKRYENYPLDEHSPREFFELLAKTRISLE
jgi:hypothetical protein